MVLKSARNSRVNRAEKGVNKDEKARSAKFWEEAAEQGKKDDKIVLESCDKDGFFLVDKVKGKTSFDEVRDIRKKYAVKKAGHSGTLDCSATGLLIVAIGNGTKLLQYLLGCDKEYEVWAFFGAFSDTYDRDGSVEYCSCKKISRKKIEREILRNFSGELLQVPPKYSALKIKGVRASDLMRRGETVELAPRKIRVSFFEILRYEWPKVKFKLCVSSGTYIRSIINDLGENLDCCALVDDLRRTKINDFSVNDAGSFLSLEQMARKFPFYELSDLEYAKLKNGGILSQISVEIDICLMAFYKGRFVGVLEKNLKNLIKLKKRV